MERRCGMHNVIYVPLEHIDQRYTVHLDNDIRSFLEIEKYDFITVYPESTDNRVLKEGMFLDAFATIRTKASQIYQIAALYEEGKVTNDTQFFFSDIWFPGIESLAYLNYFYKVTPRITGILHAGSFTDTDFVRDMERWAKNFEDVIFDICDTVFVASNFIRNDVIKKRMIAPHKIVVTSLPLDSNLNHLQGGFEKENIVVFNGRLCDEKQPHLFKELESWFKNHYSPSESWQFISTMEKGLSKKEYYHLLSRSKAVVSFALQENFGYGIAEAVKLGCVPIVPNRLVYPEIYEPQFRYNSIEECRELLLAAMDCAIQAPKLRSEFTFKTWFE